MHPHHGRVFPRVVYTVAQINVHYVLITMVVDHPHSGRGPRAPVYTPMEQFNPITMVVDHPHSGRASRAPVYTPIAQFNPYYYMLTAMEVDDHRYPIYPDGRI